MINVWLNQRVWVLAVLTNEPALTVKAGNSDGGRITKWFDLLSLHNLLVRNQLHLSTHQKFSF